MSDLGKKILDTLVKQEDLVLAEKLSGFFKTGEGQYGEGDCFLGLKVPVTRGIAKDFENAGFPEVDFLTGSKYHEARLCGFMILINVYSKNKKSKKPDAILQTVDFYLSILKRGNNWDLVDLVAPKILGDAVLNGFIESDILDTLAVSKNLWEQRCAVVSTLTLIKKERFEEAFRIIIQNKNHPHDLIQKANGWMLREIGKKDKARLLSFLDEYGESLPRTTLRYSIERLPENERRYYMGKK